MIAWTGFIVIVARQAGVVTPLVDACVALYEQTLCVGHDDSDVVPVVHALEPRTNLHTGKKV